MKEEFNARIENDVYRHAYLHLLHENEQLKNKLWKAEERMKRARTDIERVLKND